MCHKNFPSSDNALPELSQHTSSDNALLTSGVDPEGGAGDARPPLFTPYSLKSPLNWPKNLGGEPPNPLRPLLFQILDPPLNVTTNCNSRTDKIYL